MKKITLIIFLIISYSVNSSCLPKYDQSLKKYKELFDKFDAKFEKTGNVINNTGKTLGALASLSMIIPAIQGGGLITSSIGLTAVTAAANLTSGVLQMSIGLSIINFTDYKENRSFFKEKIGMLVNARSLIKDFYFGDSPDVRKVYQIIWNELGDDISSELINETVIQLDQEMLFCSDEDKLDTTAGIIKKIIKELE